MRPDETSRRAVLDAVDRLAGRLAASLSEAIRIPSVNPKYPGQDYDRVVGPEGEVARLMADLYAGAGADVELVAVEKGRDNACARIRGTGGGRSLLLNGHVDVVPPGREHKWSATPFSGQITDEAVLGRGATDDKAGTVAAAYAALALKEAGVRLRGDLVLQAVVGEEIGDHECGTTAALEAGYTADAAIVCEPSNFGEEAPNLVPVTPGLLWFSVSLEGKAAHSGLRGLTVHPTLEGEALGVNTVDKFWVVYSALRQLENEWALRDRHPLFRPGYFNILPGVLRANPEGIEVPFFLADTLTAEYCIYHHPDRTNEEVIAEVEETVRRACANDSWLRQHPPVFEWKLLWPPYTTPSGHELVASLIGAHSDAVGGFEVSTPPVQEGFLGVCDLTWLDAKGVDGLVYGPGVGRTAHAEDEYVPIHQLITAAKTYALTAMDFCGVADGEPA
ncbi:MULTISPECIES: M20/M25/M40 family metallo-hydrolase [Amycolatopsis]|uniref:Acetylornithine deacetylase n=2 Tax=Amycolatopsis TaxID=1813 RepID=A0A1I4BL28_9PSEU|nr:M20/M25/M40 family metallo-hydrolase [Amycolatopsis sacchari]SFK69534.1 acetylornithine deacetylase [Amycolatopsis sacchari]